MLDVIYIGFAELFGTGWMQQIQKKYMPLAGFEATPGGVE